MIITGNAGCEKIRMDVRYFFWVFYIFVIIAIFCAGKFNIFLGNVREVNAAISSKPLLVVFSTW